MFRVSHLKLKFGEELILKDINFFIDEKEFVCLVGESGSGKSTIAETIVGFNKEYEGTIQWTGGSNHSVQYIYQNPDRSFNPFWTMEQSLKEPLLLRKVPKQEANKKILSLLRQANLPIELLSKKPNQCSGGQKQRMAIIRALLCNPKLLVADEITSALDPQTEVTIIELLKKFQRTFQMSVIYITHRIQNIKEVADRILVLNEGVIVEEGVVRNILESPQHSYTKELVDASLYFKAIADSRIRRSYYE